MPLRACWLLAASCTAICSVTKAAQATEHQKHLSQPRILGRVHRSSSSSFDDWYTETDKLVLEQVLSDHDLCRTGIVAPAKDPQSHEYSCPDEPDDDKYCIMCPGEVTGQCYGSLQQVLLRRWHQFRGMAKVTTMFDVFKALLRQRVNQLWFMGDSVTKQTYKASLCSARRAKYMQRHDKSNRILSIKETNDNHGNWSPGAVNRPLSDQCAYSCPTSGTMLYYTKIEMLIDGSKHDFTIAQFSMYDVHGGPRLYDDRHGTQCTLHALQCLQSHGTPPAIVANLGLHYLVHTPELVAKYRRDVEKLFRTIMPFAGKFFHFTETSAQHFATKTGDYAPADHFVDKSDMFYFPGRDGHPTCIKPSESKHTAEEVAAAPLCSLSFFRGGILPHSAYKDARLCKWGGLLCDVKLMACAASGDGPVARNTRNKIAREVSRRYKGSQIVPFFDFTIRRPEMHRLRDANDGAPEDNTPGGPLREGWNLDCSHFCTDPFSPLFWEPFWHALAREESYR